MANNFRRTVQHSLQIDIASGTKTIQNTPSVTPEPWPPAPIPADYWVSEFAPATYTGYPVVYLGVAFDSQNNSISVGFIKDPDDATLFKSIVTKYDPVGDVIWSKVLNPPDPGWTNKNNATSVAISATDDIYIVGDYDFGSKGNYFAKLDSNGNAIWLKETYGLMSSTFKICLDSSNNSYISANSGPLVKLNASGDFVWYKYPESSTGTGIVYGWDIAISGSNIFFAVGGSETHFIILDLNGNVQKAYYFGANWPASLGITRDGLQNAYIYNASGGFVKFNTVSETLAWQKYLYLSAPSASFSLCYANDKVYFSGIDYFDAAGFFNNDKGVFCIQINPADGALDWSNSIVNPNYTIRTDYQYNCEQMRTKVSVNGSQLCMSAFVGTDSPLPGAGLVIKLPSDGSLSGAAGAATFGSYYYTDNTTLVGDQANSLIPYPQSLSVTDKTSATSMTSFITTVDPVSTSYWANYTGAYLTYNLTGP